MTRQQPRFERDNLRDVSYVVDRMIEIAHDYPEYLGMPAQAWLTAVATRLARSAGRMRDQGELFGVGDVLVDQIALAADRDALLRMRGAHWPTGRWTERHDAAAKTRIAEIERRLGG